jgi:nucleotide-binding universal stress UspA family protein
VKDILVALDFSKHSGEVVERAASLAQASGSKLWLLHVGPPEADLFGRQLLRKVVEGDVPDALSEEHEQLERAAADLRKRGLEAETVLVRGTPVESILEEAGIRDVETIVLGSHGRNPLFRAFIGSVSEGVLRGTTRPVLIVPVDTGAS